MRTGFKVYDAMTHNPIFVSPDTSLVECARIMKANKVGALLLKEDGEIKGIFTEGDVMRKCVADDKHPRDVKAIDIIDPNIRTISPGADIYEALVKMKDLNIRHLPVVDGNEFMGLLTLKDVLKIQPQLFDLLVEGIQLREQERKTLSVPKEKEGICQLCGKYHEELFEEGNSLVCGCCRRDV